MPLPVAGLTGAVLPQDADFEAVRSAMGGAVRMAVGVSVPVAVDRLREAIADTNRAPYLVTVSDDGRPHTVAVDFTWRGDALVLSTGNRSLANGRARGLVTLLWPPADRTGYSLIVDASVITADGDGSGDNALTVEPTSAVLHRPARQPTDSGCRADCVPLRS